MNSLILRVYSTPTCPRCEQLKAALGAASMAFENVNMSLPESITELRINGVFTLSAPVLQADDQFFTIDDLFDGEKLVDLSLLI